MKAAKFLLFGVLFPPAVFAADLPRGPDWQVAGRLGLLQFVDVAESRAKDRFARSRASGRQSASSLEDFLH